MASILEEFAYGNVSPETQYFKRDSKYGRAMELVSRNEQKLLDKLGAEDKDLFQKYVDAQGRGQPAYRCAKPCIWLPAGAGHDSRSLCGHGQPHSRWGGIAMPDYIRDAFARMDLQQIRSFLLYGTEDFADRTRPYKETLKKESNAIYKRLESLYPDGDELDKAVPTSPNP